jgi:hypothetical protein
VTAVEKRVKNGMDEWLKGEWKPQYINEPPTMDENFGNNSSLFRQDAAAIFGFHGI